MRKEYNQIRDKVYNLSLFCAELEKLEKGFPLLKEEALKIIEEESEKLENILENIRKGVN